LFIKKLAKASDNKGEKIKCIPNNEEKYISFSKDVIADSFIDNDRKGVLVKRELRFIDSFRFMASSLDALSKNLDAEQCHSMCGSTKLLYKRCVLNRKKAIFDPPP